MEDELPDFAGERDIAPEAPAETPIQQADAPQESAPPPPSTPVAEAAPQPTPEPGQTIVDPATGQQVPLPTFLDMRDRANAAEKRAKELEDWRRQQEAQARRQPPPSREQDPEAYEAYREQQFGQQLYSMKMASSRRFAEMQHGPDVVKSAFEWGAGRCDQDPFFNEKVRQSDDPIGLVVEEWRRDQVAAKVDPTDFEAFLAWKAAQQPGQPAPANPAAPQAQQPGVRPAAPRPSIAAAPSAGATPDPQGMDGQAAYQSMFGS